jgi:hypothetical protein
MFQKENWQRWTLLQFGFTNRTVKQFAERFRPPISAKE